VTFFNIRFKMLAIAVVVVVVYFAVTTYKSLRYFGSRLNVKGRFITCILFSDFEQNVRLYNVAAKKD